MMGSSGEHLPIRMSLPRCRESRLHFAMLGTTSAAIPLAAY